MPALKVCTAGICCISGGAAVALTVLLPQSQQHRSCVSVFTARVHGVGMLRFSRTALPHVSYHLNQLLFVRPDRAR